MADLNILKGRKEKKKRVNAIERASQNEATLDSNNYIDRNEVIILPELESYIRKQDEEEAQLFRESIETEGIREPLLLVNIEGHNNLLIDGHHRYRASENSPTIPVKYVTTLTTLDDIKLWMLKNQLGRRNLLDAERIDIALKITEFMAEKAKANQLATLKQNQAVDTDLSNLTKREKINTREEVSKLSGASTGNIAKYKKIKKEASPEVLNDVLSGRTSIHSAYQGITKKAKPQKTKEVKLKKISLQKKMDGYYATYNTLEFTESKLSNEEIDIQLQKIEKQLFEAKFHIENDNRGPSLMKIAIMMNEMVILKDKLEAQK